MFHIGVGSEHVTLDVEPCHVAQGYFFAIAKLNSLESLGYFRKNHMVPYLR